MNAAAWHLGIPWVDAAVGGDEWLARCNAYWPSFTAPCMECSWTPDDYSAVEQRLPCADGNAQPAATGAPSHLGALAAALQAAECQKLLEGSHEVALVGRQSLIDLRHHQQLTTRFRRNSSCRFDHETWQIEPLELPLQNTSLADLGKLTGSDDFKSLSVELCGHTFAGILVCRNCQYHRSMPLYVTRRTPDRLATCDQCGGDMMARGIDQLNRISYSSLERRDQSRSLKSIGFREGDIVAVGGSAEVRRFEILSAGSERRSIS